MYRFLLTCLIVLICSMSAFADVRVKSYEQQDSSGTAIDGTDWDEHDTWAIVDTSSATSVWFVINSSNHVTKEYAGYSTITIWFDTTTTLGHNFVATLDTVDIVVSGLKWDFSDSQYEESSRPASGDTIQVKTDWRWNGGTYVSTKFQLSAVLNHRTGWDALKLEVTAGLTTMPFRFRARLDVSEDR